MTATTTPEETLEEFAGTASVTQGCPVGGHDAEAARLIAEGKLAYVAIDTGRGPLVTPVLYGVAAGSIWFVTNRRALKAKVLRRRPQTAFAIRSGNRAVVVTGHALVLSPLRPHDLLRSPTRLTRVPFAVSSWARRNPRQVAGFLRDGALAPKRAMPHDQVLVELRPETTRVVDDGPALDGLPEAATLPPVRTSRSRRLRAALPAELVGLVTSRSGVLGLSTPSGPIAVPVAWDHRRQVAVLPAGTESPADGASACLTLDEPVHTRPTDQRGIVLRGHAHRTEDQDGNPVGVSLDARRVTYWSGFTTVTVDLAAR